MEEITQITVLKIEHQNALIEINTQKQWAKIGKNIDLFEGLKFLALIKKTEKGFIVKPAGSDIELLSTTSLNIII